MLRIVVTFGSRGDSMNKSNWEVFPIKSFCRSSFSAVIQIKAMRVPTPFEKLVGTPGDCCQNDFLVLVVSAFDRNHPVVATLSGLLLHSRTSFCIHLCTLFPRTFCCTVP